MRINVDSSVFEDIRFELVAKRVKRNSDEILSKFIRIWSWCTQHQNYFIEKRVFEALTRLPGLFNASIKEGLLRREMEKVYVSGTRGRIEWYGKILKASEAGGKANKTRIESNQIVNMSRTASQIDSKMASTPSPAPAPAPAPALKSESVSLNTNIAPARTFLESSLKTQIEDCANTWKETLRYFRQGRMLLESEKLILGRAIQQHGAKAVKLALIGAKYDPKTEKFNPADWVDLDRCLGQKNFKRFLGYGVKKTKEQELTDGKREYNPPAGSTTPGTEN